jgi:hypothetical protein
MRKDTGRLLRFLGFELNAARREIREGRFQRSMAVVTAFAAIVSGYEAYSQHVRRDFAKWPMWTPVGVAAPVVFAAAAAFISKQAARVLLPFTAAVSLIDGIAGFIFHLRGIRRMPGGFKIGQYNVVMGPPVFAPLLMCSVGLLGIFAGFLRRERLEDFRLSQNSLGTGMRAIAAGLTGGQKVSPAGTGLADGRFQQYMALSAAFLALLSGGEVYFEHMRGSFNQRWMWTPVWVSPLALAGAVGAVISRSFAAVILPVVSFLAFLDGMIGFFLHLRGIKRMPGGFRNFRFNVTMGPPLFAPLLFAAVGLLGFIASLLRRRV